jgi:hypothetical protein
MHGIESVHCCQSSNKHLQIVGYFAATRKTTVRPSHQELFA